MPSRPRSVIRVAVLAACVAVGASACVMVPLGPDGRAYGVQAIGVQAIPPNPAVIPGPASAPATSGIVTTARLYPANDLAAATGVLVGQVINHMDGRGEFQIPLPGENLIGEATRVDDKTRRGIANAYGARGSRLACEYQMVAPTRGTGTCTLSNGARYQLHIGG